jgi:uncharacterized DUF497 family protein
MRFHFDARKSERLRQNPKRGIGFEEAQQIFERPYYLDQRIDAPEQCEPSDGPANVYTALFSRLGKIVKVSICT